MERDYQRQRVYDAEGATTAWKASVKAPLTYGQMELLVYRITRSAWWKREQGTRWNRRRVSVERSLRKRNGADGCEWGIGISRCRIHLMLILHELAHTLSLRKHGRHGNMSFHGPEFCRCYLDLVKRYYCPYFARELMDSFRTYGVDTGSIATGRLFLEAMPA